MTMRKSQFVLRNADDLMSQMWRKDLNWGPYLDLTDTINSRKDISRCCDSMVANRAKEWKEEVSLHKRAIPSC